MKLELSPRQSMVFGMLSNQKSVKEIAEEKGLQIPHIYSIIAIIRRKLGQDCGISAKGYKPHVHDDSGMRDVDNVLDEVDKGERCKGCYLIFTPRSTCTPEHCDARDDPWNNDIPKIRALMEASNDTLERERNHLT